MDKLKELLRKAVDTPLQIIDFTKPFHLHVDASSDYAVGAILSQINAQGVDQPIAFASKKLDGTQ